MAQLLLTRSEEQNAGLQKLLRRPDLSTISLPLLEPLKLPESQAMRDQLLGLDNFDAIIFISKNAVRFGLPRLETYWPQWPVQLSWFAVGQATAAALAAYDIQPSFPLQASSEGLLALPQFTTMTGQKVLVVRGEGGRETLKEGLTERGAIVDYLEVYRRQTLYYPAAALPDDDQVLALLYSGEGIEHLASLVGTASSRYTLIVPSQRLVDLALNTGFDKVGLADNQEDNAMIEALLQVLERSS